MRISDWSSDVCSSDLAIRIIKSGATMLRRESRYGESQAIGMFGRGTVISSFGLLGRANPVTQIGIRSEERRVGKECVSTCRSRWWPYHEKKNRNNIKTVICRILTYEESILR